MARRPYQKKTRAKSEHVTHENILNAAYEAFSAQSFDRVNLDHIAKHSNVTVQTVIRRFGSKEELFEELAKREEQRILSERSVPEDAGLWEALEALIDHYERDGDAITNFIAQEHRFEQIRIIVERGRRIHREWVERHCRDILSGCEASRRERLTLSAIAATDLGTWKLLRRDLGLERPETTGVIRELLQGLIYHQD